MWQVYKKHAFDFLLPSLLAVSLIFIAPAIYSWAIHRSENDVLWFVLYPLVMTPVRFFLTGVGGIAFIFAPLMMLLESANIQTVIGIWVGISAVVLLGFILLGMPFAKGLAAYLVVTLGLHHAFGYIEKNWRSA